MQVALLSDIHANLVALEAVLAALPPVDRLWVTGDTVGYGPDPADTLALLRERHATLVAGNHDRAVATGTGLELFNPVAAAAVAKQREWLSAEDRDALAALPVTLALDAFTLVHGSLRDPLWEYVFDAPVAAATLRIAPTAHCCAGHTHVPAIFRLGKQATVAERIKPDVAYPLTDRLLINPGSVGQPRDGDPRSAYAILDLDRGTATFHRASYGVAETQRRILARGLPEMLADRLAFGI